MGRLSVHSTSNCPAGPVEIAGYPDPLATCLSLELRTLCVSTSAWEITGALASESSMTLARILGLRFQLSFILVIGLAPIFGDAENFVPL